MKRHAAGTGSSLTRQWYLDSTEVRLAGILLVDHPGREREIKNAGHFKKWCPVCQGMISGDTIDMRWGLRSLSVPTSQADKASLKLAGPVCF